jgi:hypothetical protein
MHRKYNHSRRTVVTAWRRRAFFKAPGPTPTPRRGPFVLMPGPTRGSATDGGGQEGAHRPSSALLWWRGTATTIDRPIDDLCGSHLLYN